MSTGNIRKKRQDEGCFSFKLKRGRDDVILDYFANTSYLLRSTVIRAALTEYIKKHPVPVNIDRVNGDVSLVGE